MGPLLQEDNEAGRGQVHVRQQILIFGLCVKDISE